MNVAPRAQVSQRIGYIRVSSVGKNSERQLDGVEVDQVYTDTV